MNDANPTNDPNKNPDPITGEPGSHPLGTGLGTAGAGVAGAAIGGAVGGPIGAAIGAVVGGIAGAAGGHGIAEAVNPTQEEAYWRENHSSQPYADQEFPTSTTLRRIGPDMRVSRNMPVRRTSRSRPISRSIIRRPIQMRRCRGTAPGRQSVLRGIESRAL